MDLITFHLIYWLDETWESTGIVMILILPFQLVFMAFGDWWCLNKFVVFIKKFKVLVDITSEKNDLFSICW